jgi:hypothetical protein
LVLAVASLADRYSSRQVMRLRHPRVLVFLAALVLVLSACGRTPATGSNETPSPTAVASPGASPTAAPTPLTIPGPTFSAAEVGLAYSAVTITASGGNSPYLWRVSDGALPSGLSLSPDGVVSGTPTAAGNFAFTFEVTDASMATANLSGTIHVASKLMFQYVNHSYDTRYGWPMLNVCVEPRADHPCPNPDDRALQVATVSGGLPPYTYALASGTLPPMSSLNRVGLAWEPLSYSPGQLPMGMYVITFRVSDSLGASVVVGATYWLYRT